VQHFVIRDPRFSTNTFYLKSLDARTSAAKAKAPPKPAEAPKQAKATEAPRTESDEDLSNRAKFRNTPTDPKVVLMHTKRACSRLVCQRQMSIDSVDGILACEIAAVP
jgi:hypothetical protein